MSSESFEVRTCDRCGHSAELRAPLDNIGWGKAFFVAVSPDDQPRQIGLPTKADDVCPGCAGELFAWWLKPGDVQQPPPTPELAPRPRFTLEDRKEVIEAAAFDIGTQIGRALDVVRQAPTELLSGEPISGALEGVSGVASDIVDNLISTLKSKGFPL